MLQGVYKSKQNINKNFNLCKEHKKKKKKKQNEVY